MALRKLDMIGAAMRDLQDVTAYEDWLDRCRFSPAFIRGVFRDWPFRYEPHRPVRVDERGMNVKRQRSLDVREILRVNDISSIEHYFYRLSASDPVAYDAIVGLYLEWDRKVELGEQAERVGKYQGCTGRTVWNRAQRGIDRIAEQCGYDRHVCHMLRDGRL